MAEARSPAMGAAPLVGRAEEREAIAAALRTPAGDGPHAGGRARHRQVPAARPPRERAAAEGTIVLGARASESERDLPYALWIEALERHVEEAAALTKVLPVLSRRRGGPCRSPSHAPCAARACSNGSPSRGHSCCGSTTSHWADPASLDALAALIRRPPAGPVLFALAAREGQLPTSLASALAGAHGEDRVVALRPAPLTAAEAAELVGDVATAIYARSGGNPFFLEQLARVRSAPGLGVGAVTTTRSRPPSRRRSPPSTPSSRRTRGRCSTPRRSWATRSSPSWPPRWRSCPSRRRCARSTSCCRAGSCGRPGRRGASRSGIRSSRHAVYVATPAGWRLGAHARAAEALQRRGAGAVQRAHHVEHAAHPGDEDAIALLSDAAAELQAPAPQAAARFYAAALRLLADGPAERERRIRLQLALADAQAAAGDAAAARHDAARRARSAAGPASGWRSPSRWPTRSGGSAATRTRAAGCRSCSASCPRSRRRIASGCGSRSR